MKKIVIIFLIYLGVISCVSKSEYEKKEEEVLMLKEINHNLRTELEKQRKMVFTCTEERSVNQIKEYLNFYAPNCTFTEFKANQISPCTYDIRMRKKYNSGENGGGVIVRVSFNSDGTYKITNIDNDPLWACN